MKGIVTKVVISSSINFPFLTEFGVPWSRSNLQSQVKGLR